MSDLKDTIEFIEAVLKEYEPLKAKQPYHINVIDELHANENANSRILAKLLQFRNANGKYEILQSFIWCLQKLSGSENWQKKIQIDKPKITQEEERIDIWIRDTNYAIILENKIYDVGDQEAQLARYIEKTKKRGYDINQIFVIYMPSFPHEPASQTWKYKKENYKEEFKNRFLILSFRDHILPWLKEKVIPNMQPQDTYLLCALNQYVDYLEGMFNLREIDKKLNMEIQKILRENLELNQKATIDQYKVISEKIKDVEKILSQLKELRINVCKPKLDEIVQNYGLNKRNECCNYNVVINKITYKCSLDKDNDGDYYCQFEREDQKKINDLGIIKNLKTPELLPDTSDQQPYAIWKYTKEDYYEGLKLIEKVLEIFPPSKR